MLIGSHIRRRGLDMFCIASKDRNKGEVESTSEIPGFRRLGYDNAKKIRNDMRGFLT